MDELALVERVPSIAEYRDLRRLSGLSEKTLEAATRGLPNTIFAVVRIVKALVEWLRANAPKTAYVSLIADGPARDLYAQYGFRETAPESVGMCIWVR